MTKTQMIGIYYLTGIYKKKLFTFFCILAKLLLII